MDKCSVCKEQAAWVFTRKVVDPEQRNKYYGCEKHSTCPPDFHAVDLRGYVEPGYCPPWRVPGRQRGTKRRNGLQGR